MSHSGLPGSQSMGSCRQEYWSGLPFTSPGDFPSPGLNLHLMSSVLASGFSTTSLLGKPIICHLCTTWWCSLQRLYSTYSYYKLLAIFCVVQCMFVAYFIPKNLYLLLVYPISCFWLPLQSHFLLLSSWPQSSQPQCLDSVSPRFHFLSHTFRSGFYLFK